MVYSISIPYDENVVKDANYNNNTDDFGKLILKIKSYNWDIQNPAIDKILNIPPKSLNKNQQFILGRNLLQASGAAFSAETYMKEIQNNIGKYTIDKENHVLNGILFEIYFNSHADFRKDKTKKHYFDNIISLRKIPELKSSFDFIRSLIELTKYPLIYLPKSEDEYIDIEIVAVNEKTLNFIGEEVIYQVISKITYNGLDLTKEIGKFHITGQNELGLTEALAGYFTAPKELIKLHCGIKLDKIAFAKTIIDDDEWTF